MATKNTNNATTKYAAKPSDKDEPKETTLEEVTTKFKDARDYAKSSYFDIWDDCYKVYNGVRTNKSDYEGIAETFIPETFTIVESILANVAGGKPRFDFLPTQQDQTGDTKVLNAMTDVYWTQNRLGLKIIPWVRETIQFGTSVLFCTWEANGFSVRHIPLKDFFVDPTSSVIDDPAGGNVSHYAGFRYLTTVKDLEEKMVTNPDYDSEKSESDKNAKKIPLYKNLHKLKKIDRAEGADEKLDKEEKDMFNGSTLGAKAKEKQVEVIYYIDREKLVEIGNRGVVIREEDTPFKRDATTIDSVDDEGNPIPVELPEIKPFLPFAVLRNYIDSSLFYAKGDVEFILGLQEHLNDTSNQKTDNLSYILNRMFTLDPAYADKIEEIDSVPGAIFTVPPGALDQIVTQPIGADADNEMSRTKDEMRRATAADEIVQGASQDKGRITATEVQAQLAQAGTRFSMKLGVLESEGYAQLASVMLKLMQINITQEQAVRAVGPKGVEWKNYNPGEFLGDWEPKVMLDTNAKTLKLEERQKWIEYYQLVTKLPFIDQIYAFKKISEKVFDIEEKEAEAFIQQQPQTALPPGEEVPGGVTEGDIPPEVMEELLANASVSNATPAE